MDVEERKLEKSKMCMYGQLHIHQRHHATSRMYKGKLTDISTLNIINN